MAICAGGSFPTSSLFEVKARADTTAGGAHASAIATAIGRATRLLRRNTGTMLASRDMLFVVVVAGTRNAAKLAVHLERRLEIINTKKIGDISALVCL